MNIYILISIIVLGLVALLLFVRGKQREIAKLTPLAGLAFSFVLAGIFFGEHRIVGYSLIAVGVILAIIDLVIGLKRG